MSMTYDYGLFGYTIEEIVKNVKPVIASAVVDVNQVNSRQVLDVELEFDVSDIAKYAKGGHELSDLKPKYIQQSGTATIVYWNDDTYTSVVCRAEDNSNVYSAFCAAYAKKVFGSTTAVHKMVDRVLDTNIKAAKEAEERMKRKEQEERDRIAYKRRVAKRAKEIMLDIEAMKLIDEQIGKDGKEAESDDVD